MAHIIMAYKDPAQIERLVKKMSHPSFDFYLHVDAKFDLAPFEYLGKIERVYIIKNRIKIRWAGYSFTQGLLNCIQEILDTGRQYDFFSNMSGQDYPIVPNKQISEFFAERKGKSFFALEPHTSPWWDRAKVRTDRYHMTDFDFKGRYVVQSLLNTVMPIRKFPLKYTYYGGERATWWTMSAECAQYVLKFLNDNPRVRRFAKFTWAPDEYLFPTLLMNSPLRDKVITESYRYIDWSLGGSNPKILKREDFESLMLSNKLFARKFDINVDTQILDLIDVVTK